MKRLLSVLGLALLATFALASTASAFSWEYVSSTHWKTDTCDHPLVLLAWKIDLYEDGNQGGFELDICNNVGDFCSAPGPYHNFGCGGFDNYNFNDVATSVYIEQEQGAVCAIRLWKDGLGSGPYWGYGPNHLGYHLLPTSPDFNDDVSAVSHIDSPNC